MSQDVICDYIREMIRSIGVSTPHSSRIRNMSDYVKLVNNFPFMMFGIGQDRAIKILLEAKGDEIAVKEKLSEVNRRKLVEEFKKIGGDIDELNKEIRELDVSLGMSKVIKEYADILENYADVGDESLLGGNWNAVGGSGKSYSDKIQSAYKELEQNKEMKEKERDEKKNEIGGVTIGTLKIKNNIDKIKKAIGSAKTNTTDKKDVHCESFLESLEVLSKYINDDNKIAIFLRFHNEYRKFAKYFVEEHDKDQRVLYEKIEGFKTEVVNLERKNALNERFQKKIKEELSELIKNEGNKERIDELIKRLHDIEEEIDTSHKEIKEIEDKIRSVDDKYTGKDEPYSKAKIKIGNLNENKKHHDKLSELYKELMDKAVKCEHINIETFVALFGNDVRQMKEKYQPLGMTGGANVKIKKYKLRS